jgi:hypothetical protein
VSQPPSGNIHVFTLVRLLALAPGEEQQREGIRLGNDLDAETVGAAECRMDRNMLIPLVARMPTSVSLEDSWELQRERENTVETTHCARCWR